MRFGLVGTGPWARMTHGPGLVRAEGVELVGVWGRRPEDAVQLAGELGAVPYRDYAAMLEDVEAVAFAVPPEVQAVMATEAATVGKHLLLDKPVAADVSAARILSDAVEANGVSTVVFFTDRFSETTRTWLADVRATGGWLGGSMRWFSSLQQPDNPFGASSWRQERGALWDTGPHALSMLSAALGPIDSLTAVAGAGDLVIITMSHPAGRISTATLAQFAPPAAVCMEAAVWGEAGFSAMPARPVDSSVQLGVAAAELIDSAMSGRRHEVDVVFGARIVELLDQAQSQVDAQRAKRG